MIRRLGRRLGALFRRGRFEREMEEELRLHVELEIADRMRSGRSSAEARRMALRDFGGVERVKEAARDVRGLRPIDDLRQDLRFGLRVLRRSPGFALLAVVTLAIGIGAPTAVLSVADAALYRPVPGVNVPEDRLALMRLRAPHLEDEETGISYLNLMDLRAINLPAVEEIVGWSGTRFQVSVPGAVTSLMDGAAVAGDLFGSLGVHPAAGRVFGGFETGVGVAAPVAVLSEWGARVLFGEGEAVGRTVVVNGEPLTVIGVAGGGFRGSRRIDRTGLWLPYGVYGRVRHYPSDFYQDRGSGDFINVLVRLAPGATIEVAQAQLTRALGGLRDAHATQNSHFADYKPVLFADIGIDPHGASRVRATFTILLAAVSLVLFVACANVANLLLFRGVRRQSESAVRQAMGASRSRLVRQHLTESGLLAMAGVGLGVGLAIGSIRIFEAVVGDGGSNIILDARMLWFALAIGTLSILLTGLVPAVVVNKLDLTRQLKEAMPTQTGRRALLRSVFTVAQLALSLGLVIGGLLLLRTLHNLQSVELGFNPADVVEVRLDPDPRGYTDDQADRLRREVLRQARALPMATTAAAAASGPFQTHYAVDLRAGQSAGDDFPVESFADFVTPEYFDVLGIPLSSGRTFSADELKSGRQQSSDVVIVSELLARRLFGTTRALGRTIVQRGYQANTSLRVIGVVADNRTRSLDGPLEPMLYRPLGEYYSNDFVVLVNSPAPASVTVDGLRVVVNRIDGTLPFYRAGPLTRRVDEETVEERFLSRLVSILALLAALMAAVGLYGVVAFGVAEREREIGIRLALGSASSRVAWMVVRQSVMHAMYGLVFGAGLAYAVARVLESRLFGIEPLDIGTWVAAVGILLAVSLMAAVLPVLRAVRVEPGQVLRTCG